MTDLDELDARLLADTDTVVLTWDELHGLIERVRKAETSLADAMNLLTLNGCRGAVFELMKREDVRRVVEKLGL